MTTKKLFLFDLDGTLITTGGAGLRALDHTFKDLFGIDTVLDGVSPSGKTDPAIFREILAKKMNKEMTQLDFEKIKERYLEALSNEIENKPSSKSLAGVEEFLRGLEDRDDIVVGLGTGNLEDGAKIKLRPTNLLGYFKFGGYGSDAEDRAEMLKVGHKRGEEEVQENFPPADVYVIGDTPLDVLAAKKAGYKSIAVASGNKTIDELRPSNPDYLIQEMGEAIPLTQTL